MKYDAFISYRHSDVDMFVAKKVHKYLETFKVPKKVQKKTGKKKITRVFRDQEELPIGSDLGNNIQAALEDSEFLVVICSPRTTQSEWVMKEIDTFISLHGREKCLAVLVEGEPDESFPPQLLIDENGEPVEPLAADVRGSTKKEINQKLKTECMRLVASILGCDYDDLRQRHRERAMRKYIAIACGVAALGVAFGVYNAYNLAQINENYQAKLENESKTLAKIAADVFDGGDRITAALIAMEGLPIDEERPLVPESIHALSRTMNIYELGAELTHDKVLEHNIGIDKFYLNDDGNRVISYDQQENVYVWNVETGKMLFSVLPEYYDGEAENVTSAAINGDKYYICSNKTIRAYDESGNEIYKKRLIDGCAPTSEINMNVDKVMVTDFEKMYIYDLTNGEILKTYECPLEEGKFSQDMKFTDDDKYAAISNGYSSIGDTFITVFDLETDKYSTLQATYSAVCDLNFTPDGCLLIGSWDLFDLNEDKDEQISLQKFNFETGKQEWETSVDRMTNGVDMSWMEIKSRIYTDNDGEEHSEAILSATSTVYTMDLYTGEITSEIHENSNIEHFAIATDRCYGYLLRFDGVLDIVNLTTGKVYTDSSVKISDGLMIDFKLKNGVLVAKGYLSNVLTVMSYQTDEDIMELGKYDDSLEDVIVSPDETTYLVSLKISQSDYHFNYKVYDATTDKEVASFTYEEGSVYSDPMYLDDDHIIIFPYGPMCEIFEISTGKTREVMFTTEKDSTEKARMSDNRVITVDYQGFYIWDKDELLQADKKTVKEPVEVESTVSDCYISKQGNLICYYDYDNHPYLYDIEKEEVITLPGDYLVNVMTCNQDGSKVVLGCTDGWLRMYDVETAEYKEILEVYTSHSAKIQFSNDERYLYIYGSDLHFQVYDLQDEKIVFISDGQTNAITYISEDMDKGILAISNYYFMYLIDTNSWGVMEYANSGKVFMTKNEKLLSTNGNNLYGFKYKSPMELIELAVETFKDYSLTPVQRLKYNIQ